jgi:hypothetical protein
LEVGTNGHRCHEPFAETAPAVRGQDVGIGQIGDDAVVRHHPSEADLTVAVVVQAEVQGMDDRPFDVTRNTTGSAEMVVRERVDSRHVEQVRIRRDLVVLAAPRTPEFRVGHEPKARPWRPEHRSGGGRNVGATMPAGEGSPMGGDHE